MSDIRADATAEVVVNTDEDSAFYWSAAAEGRLSAQRCATCNRLWHPPGPACPHCQSLEWSIDDLPLDGVIYCAAEVHRPGSPIQGTNYLIALVEITDPRRPGESVRVAGNLRGATLAEATIGTRAVVHFEQLAGGHRLPQFHLEGTARR